jgi:hypothetical protein
MSEVALRLISALSSPLSALYEKIHKYQEKKETKELFASALQSEIKEYDGLVNDLAGIGKKCISTIEQVKEQPANQQVFEILDIISESPKLLARFVLLFVKLAKACKDLSCNKAFMASLMESSHFLYDFVERMADLYSEEDNIAHVVIDSRFFRFFNTYKKEILKKSTFKKSKINKKEIKLIEEKANAVVRYFNQPFLQRHVRKLSMRKWKRSLLYFEKTSKSIMFKQSIISDMTEEMKEFMPFDLQTLEKLLKGYS